MWTSSHRRVTAGAILVALAAACDVTHVSDPNNLLLPDLQNPQGAAALRAGALAEMAVLSSQALYSGLLVDEFSDTPTAVTGFPEDRRTVTAANQDYPFGSLSNARLDALNAIAALKAYAPTPAWRVGELYAMVATIEIVFSENLCSGVPLATITNGVRAYGPTLTRDQMLARSLVDLDSAAAYTTGSDSIASLVSVLQARALLDQGQPATAAAAVANVPLSFAYAIQFSGAATNQQNGIFNLLTSEGLFTVSDREGTNGLPFVSAGDPRVQILTVTSGNGTVIAPVDGSSVSSPITLASGVEAQLTIAEAALAAGQTSTWTTVLNTLRQTAITPSIAPLPADSSTAASPTVQLAVMFRERAFWLFATGHRHGDLRRLVRQYGLPVESVFPTGLYEGGPLSYGTAVVFLPFGESYDANYAGCADIKA